MNCPAPEDLSRWNDGAADPAAAAAIERHVDACDACRARVDGLRAAADWIDSIAEPGPDCLSADDMAALLDGARAVPDHVRLCPRCAAEYRALRPAKKATRRLHRARAGAAPWIAAAAAVLLAVVGLAVGLRPKPPESIATKTPPPPPAPPKPRPQPELETPVPLPERERLRPVPLPPPPIPLPPPAPAPDPKTPDPVVPPKTDVPEPKTPPSTPPPPTIVEPARKAVAVAVKAGALAVAQGPNKWVKAARVEEGQTLRAEGRTVCEFAGALVTLEASSRVEFQSFDIALHEGGLSAEVAPGARFGLAVGGQRIEPVASSRVMMVARPDKVVVEEGAAKAAGAVLHEGVEYAVRKDRLEPQKRRSLPAAARPREIPTWKLDFSQPALLAPRTFGRVSVDGGERFLAATPLGDNPYWQGQVGFHSGDVAKPLFVVKPGTTLRFRYFLSQPAEIELVIKNQTKDENYNRPLTSVVGRWTTVTIPVREVAPNRGGKQVPCEIGDMYVSWGVFVGRPGSTAQLYVDQLEIVEVDR